MKRKTNLKNKYFILFVFTFLFFTVGKVKAGSSTSDTTAPTVPTNLQVVSNTVGAANLSWSASSDPDDAASSIVYKIFQCAGQNCTPAYVASTLGGQLFYNATGLSSGIYGYNISAADAAGKTSANTATVYVTITADSQAPGQPTNLIATTVSQTKINLSWTASTDNIGVSGYKIFRNGVQVDTSASTSYSDSGLTPSTTYTYAVSAYDAGGNTSAQSENAQATTLALSAPGVPTIGTATSQNAAISVVFSAPTLDGGSAITGYTATCTSSNGGATGSNSGSSSPIVVTGLTNNYSYTCTVVATNTIGSSSPSAASNQATPADSVPSAPQNVAAYPGNTTATVIFSAPAQGTNITSYSATSTPTTTTQTCAGSSPCVLTFTGLTNGTSYTFSVTATNSMGTSPASISNTITPFASVNSATFDSVVKSFSSISSPTFGNISWAQDFSGNPQLYYVSKLGSSGNGTGQFASPSGIVADSKANIYVADSTNNKIIKYAPNGAYILQFGGAGTGNGKFSTPNALAVDLQDNIYVGDNNSLVQKFDSSGKFISQFGSAGTGNGQFSTVRGIAVNSQGYVYVSDGGSSNRVQKFAPDGSYVLTLSGVTFSNPTGISIDSQGNIFVANYSLANVCKFSSNDAYITKFGISGSSDGQLSFPTSIAFDSKGNIYVSDTGNKRLQIFNSSFTFISKFGTSGSGNGQFNGMGKIAADNQGNFFITDYMNNNVQKLNLGVGIKMRVRTSDDPDMSGAHTFDDSCNVNNNNPVTTNSAGQQNPCVTSGNQYVQYEAILSTDAGTSVPQLGNVTISTKASYPTNPLGSYLISSPFNSGGQYNSLSNITWNADTTKGSVKFQLRTSADGISWGPWCGPTVCSATPNNATSFATGSDDAAFYATNTGNTINSLQKDNSGDQYFQYAAFLASNDGSGAPTLQSVTTNYSYNVPPAIALDTTPTNLKQQSDGTYTIPFTLSETYDDNGNIQHGTTTSAIKAGLFYQPDSGSSIMKLQSALTNSQTGSINILNPNNVPIPTNGTILVDSELISYTGATTSSGISTINITTRAANFATSYPTTAATHNANADVYFLANPTLKSIGGCTDGTCNALAATGTKGTQATTPTLTFNWDPRNDANSNLNGQNLSNMNLMVVAHDGDSLNLNTIGKSNVAASQKLDLQAPNITDVSVVGGPNKTFKLGDTVTLQFSFTVGDTVSISDNPNQVWATVGQGSSARTCAISQDGTCSFVVQASDDWTSPIKVLNFSTSNSSSFLKDQFGNTTSISGPSVYLIPTGKNIDDKGVISYDGVNPQVTNLSLSNNSYINGSNDITSSNSALAFTLIEASHPLQSGLIKFTPVDTGTTIQCTLKGNALNNDTFSYSKFQFNGNNCAESNLALSDGKQYKLDMAFSDAVGNNYSISQVSPITYDKTAPSVSAPTVPASTNNPKPSINWTAATDAGSGVATYELQRKNSADPDSSFADVTGASVLTTTTFTEQSNLADGSYTYRIFATDNAGNKSLASEKVVMFVDTAAPTGSMAINGNSSSPKYTNSSAVNLNLNFQDLNGSGLDIMSFSNDNTNWSTPESYLNSKSWNLSNNDGEKTVYVKIVDKAGNVYQTSDVINLDTQAPIISIDSPQMNQRFNSGEIKFTLNEALASAQIILSGPEGDHQINLSGQQLTTINSLQSVLVTGLVSNNSYTVKIAGKDLAGNDAVDNQISNVVYDITKPVITITAPQSDEFINSISNASDFSYTIDNISETENSLDSVWISFADGNQTQTCTLKSSYLSNGNHDNVDLTQACNENVTLADGTAYSISIQGKDLAGNTSGENKKTNVTFDISAPVLQNFSTSDPERFITDQDPNGPYGKGSVIHITANFNEPVTSGSNVTVVLENSTNPPTEVLLDAVDANTISGSFVVDGPRKGFDTTNQTIRAVKNISVYDRAGNQQANAQNSMPQDNTLGKNIAIDTGTPILQSFTAQAGAYKAGSKITITANYSKYIRPGSSISIKLGGIQSTQSQAVVLDNVSQNKISGVYTVADGDNVDNLQVTEITSQNVSDFKNPPNTLTDIGTMDAYNAIFAAYNPPIEAVLNLSSGIRVDTVSPTNSLISIYDGATETKSNIVNLKLSTEDNFADLLRMKIQFSNDGKTWCDQNGNLNSSSDYSQDIAGWNLMNQNCGLQSEPDAITDNIAANVFVKFIDSAGNENSVKDDITYNGVPPRVVEVNSSVDPNVLYGPGMQIPISLKYNKALSSSQTSTASVYFNNNGYATLTKTADDIMNGTYTVSVSTPKEDTNSLAINSLSQDVFDSAGNEQTSTSLPVKAINNLPNGIHIDTTAPVGQLNVDRSIGEGNMDIYFSALDANGIEGMKAKLKVLDDISSSCAFDGQPGIDVTSENMTIRINASDTSYGFSDNTDPKKVCLQLIDRAGNASSPSAIFASAITPETPQNLAVTDNSNISAGFYGTFLTWKAPIDGNQGTGGWKSYEILHCKTGTTSQDCVPNDFSDSYRYVITDSPDTNYFSYNNLSPDSKYCYRIRFRDRNGDRGDYSKFSPVQCVVPGTNVQVSTAQIDVRNGEGDISIFDINKSGATVNFRTQDIQQGSVAFATIANIDVYATYSSLDKDGNPISNKENWLQDKVATFTDSGIINIDGNGKVSVTNPNPTAKHTIKLTGLASGKQYYLKIIALDPQDYTHIKNLAFDGEKGINSNLTFTTLGALSKIYNISDPPTFLSDKDVVLDFRTDQNANCYIEFGTNSLTQSTTSTSSQTDQAAADATCLGQQNGTSCSIANTSGKCDGSGKCVALAQTTATYNEIPVKETEGEYSTNHSIHLASLLPQTIYYYKLTCGDESKDNPSIVSFGEGKFRTLDKQLTEADFTGRLDGIAPEISNIAIPTITGEGATVTWSTNEPSNSLVAYSLEGTDYMLMAGDYTVNSDHTKYSTTHSVNVAGLLPASKYIFTVLSADGSGNIGQSSPSNFTTKLPSSLSSIKVVSTALGQATITWQTGSPASSIVQYGLTTAYGQTKQDSSMTKDHTIILEGLTPGQTYHFQVKGEDETKNIFASSDITFQPQAPPKIDNFKIDSISEHEAKVSFATNVPTSTLVTYVNTANPDDNGAQGKSDMISSHTIQLKNLTSGATFSIKVKVNDENGNETEEDFANFTTQKDTTPPKIDRVKTDSALTQDSKVQSIISWTTDELSTGQIVYKEGREGAEKTIDVNTTPSYSHVAVITSFKPGTVYYFNVRSTDVSGNVSKSSDYALLTPKQSQNIIQVIIGNFTDIFGWAKFGK